MLALAMSIIFPIGILLSGVFSCFKKAWIGLLPTIIYSLIFLSLYWIDNVTINMIGEIFLYLSFISVAVFGICRLVIFIFKNHKNKKKNSDIEKSKVKDL